MKLSFGQMLLGLALVVMLAIVLMVGGALVYRYLAPESETVTVAQPARGPIMLPTAIPQQAPAEVQSMPDQPAALEVVSPDATGELFLSPVSATDVFNQESAWLIAEPGVILDETAAWTIPGTREPWYINVPEGGFTFYSLGHGDITLDGVTLHLPGAEGRNYLVVTRGRIDDTIVDSDLNETAMITNFTVGHAIWSIMPPGAYVSKDWFRDQLVVSTTTGGTNCGATGCSTVRIVLFDVDTHFTQVFETHAGDIDNWTLIQ